MRESHLHKLILFFCISDLSQIDLRCFLVLEFFSDIRLKKLISDIYNYGIDAKPQIESIGLFYQGSIHSFYYIEETDTWVDQSALDIFKDNREGIVVTRRTKSRVFSLVNLAAEKISESLSNKEDLETLVRSTQIPAVCANTISRCL